jgi:Na+/H+-dicarboxylate symporter
MRARRLTTAILIGMILGIAMASVAMRSGPTRGQRPKSPLNRANYKRFLRLIKMIIAPLVFSTLVVGLDAYGRPGHRRPHRNQSLDLVRLRLAGIASAGTAAG